MIVLLILAGVSINFIFGKEGIFTKTQTAVKTYQNAQNEEEIQIAKYSNEIDRYVEGGRDYKVSYSTSEQEIGTWINNKPLYQKTITGLNITPTWNNNWHNLQTSISPLINDIDKIISAKAYGSAYADSSYSGTVYDAYFDVNINKTDSTWKISCSNSDYLIINTMTIQYTKK